MDETSLIDMKIKAEAESSDASIGSDIVYSMIEPPFPEVVTQQDGEDEVVHVLRAEQAGTMRFSIWSLFLLLASFPSLEEDEAVGPTCKIKVRKREQKGSLLAPTEVVSEEDDSKGQFGLMALVTAFENNQTGTG